MTAIELYNRLTPSHTETMSAQRLVDGLNFNSSSMFTKLIRDAARCNSYSSDIFYDLLDLHGWFKNFDPERNVGAPMFIGFRRHGVDGTNFVLNRIERGNDGNTIFSELRSEYFALYSVIIEHEEGDWYKVIFNEYYL